MIYLLLGEDSLLKDEKIKAIKQKAGIVDDGFSFDAETVHGHKLSPADLKKTLVSLPALVERRVVVIRQLTKLTPYNQKLLLEFCQEPQSHLILILDTEESQAKTAFLKKIGKLAEVIRCGTKEERNVFSVTNAMKTGDLTSALKALNDLIEDGQHPLQLMGGLLWFWGSVRERMSQISFQKGLDFLRQADLNIKRSRLNPETAVEMLVIQLTRCLR